MIPCLQGACDVYYVSKVRENVCCSSVSDDDHQISKRRRRDKGSYVSYLSMMLHTMQQGDSIETYHLNQYCPLLPA